MTTRSAFFNFAVVTGAEILIGISPGIFRQTIEVLFPVSDIRIGRLGDKCVEALLTGGVAEIVQTIELQGTLDTSQVLLYSRSLRIVNAANDVRRHDGCENTQDDYDHHDLDERESALLDQRGRAFFDAYHRIAPH